LHFAFWRAKDACGPGGRAREILRHGSAWWTTAGIVIRNQPWQEILIGDFGSGYELFRTGIVHMSAVWTISAGWHGDPLGAARARSSRKKHTSKTGPTPMKNHLALNATLPEKRDATSARPVSRRGFANWAIYRITSPTMCELDHHPELRFSDDADLFVFILRCYTASFVSTRG